MLKLLDVMSIQKEDLHKYKLHLAINPKNKKEPLYELFKGNFKSWQDNKGMQPESEMDIEPVRSFAYKVLQRKPDNKTVLRDR